MHAKFCCYKESYQQNYYPDLKSTFINKNLHNALVDFGSLPKNLSNLGVDS